MGLSVDLELACDDIEMNSKHKPFSVPVDRVDDKKAPEAAVAVDSVASIPTDAKVRSPAESTKSHPVILLERFFFFGMTQINENGEKINNF